MSNRLGGKQGTAYLGTNANQPPNWVFDTRDPNEYDIKNVSLGDLWLNKINESVWVLVSLQGNTMSRGSLATWIQLESGGGTGLLNELTGDTGGAILPDGLSNITFHSGISGLSFDGNAGAHTITLNSTIGGDLVQTLTGNSGPAVTALAGNINVVGDGTTITIVGNAGTHTLTASLVGDVAIAFPTDSGTAHPSGGNLNIIANTATRHAGSTVSFSGSGNTVQLNVTDSHNNTMIGLGSGGTATTGTLNTVLGQGSGIALTTGSSNTIIGQGAGFLLTTGSDNILLGANSGAFLTTSDNTNTLIGHEGVAGSTDLLVIAAGADGAVIMHNFPGSNASTSNGKNLFIGDNAGNFTLAGAPGNAGNDGIGDGALSSLTTGARNDAMGAFALSRVTSGSDNIGIGSSTGFNSGGGTGLVSGNFNVFLGYSAGNAYTAAESNNITISATGVAAESNVLRIANGTGGGQGQLNKAFISGIHGVNVGSVATVVTEFGNQLGTAVLTAGSNITITPGANTITIASTGGGGGAAVSFLAYLVGGPFGPSNPIPYDTLAYNNGGGYNLGTNLFTAPNTGIYNFSFGLVMSNAQNNNTWLQAGIQTASIGNSFQVLTYNPANMAPSGGGNNNISFGSNVYVRLTAGDTVSTNVNWNNSGGLFAIQASGVGLIRNFFSGVFVG